MDQDRVRLREAKTAVDPNWNLAVRAHVTEIAAAFGKRHAKIDISVFVGDAKEAQSQLRLIGVTRLSAAVQDG